MNAIYLAAGKSSRMREHKLSMSLGDTTIGNKALSILLQSDLINYVFVVVNDKDTLKWISGENKYLLTGIKGQIIVCANAHKGLSSSLKEGFSFALTKPEDKILVCLADQPYINEEMINSLYQVKMDAKDEFVASSNRGEMKPPILFRREAYHKVLMLEGDTGARKLIKNGALQGKKIEFSEDKWFVDIDTKEEYFYLKREEELF